MPLTPKKLQKPTRKLLLYWDGIMLHPLLGNWQWVLHHHPTIKFNSYLICHSKIYMYLFFWWLAIWYACIIIKNILTTPTPCHHPLMSFTTTRGCIGLYKSINHYGQSFLKLLMADAYYFRRYWVQVWEILPPTTTTRQLFFFHFFCRVSVLFDSDLLVWQHIYSFAMCHRHGEDNYHMSPKVNYHSQRLDPYICTSNGCPVVCLGWSLGYSAIDRYVQNVSIQMDTNNGDNHSTICIRTVFTIWCRWRNTIPGCNHEFTCHYRFYDIMEEE